MQLQLIGKLVLKFKKMSFNGLFYFYFSDRWEYPIVLNPTRLITEKNARSSKTCAPNKSEVSNTLYKEQPTPYAKEPSSSGWVNSWHQHPRGRIWMMNGFISHKRVPQYKIKKTNVWISRFTQGHVPLGGLDKPKARIEIFIVYACQR